MRYGGCSWFCFASGMAAVYSTLAALLNSGDHIVSSRCFGATHSLFINYFPKWNITSYFDINQPETIEGLITPDKNLYLQSHQPILLLILLI
jgi:O-succinylhomoserine sulfhydrylase